MQNSLRKCQVYRLMRTDLEREGKRISCLKHSTSRVFMLASNFLYSVNKLLFGDISSSTSYSSSKLFNRSKGAKSPTLMPLFLSSTATPRNKSKSTSSCLHCYVFPLSVSAPIMVSLAISSIEYPCNHSLITSNLTG